MLFYKNILIAVNCYLNYNNEVGLFINEGKLQLVGEAVLYKKRGKLFADIHSEIDISDYYPKINAMGQNIDTLLLFKGISSHPKIKTIREQLESI